MRKAVTLLACCTLLSAVEDPRITTALAGLDQEFDTSFAWWGKLYDPRSGGCYYALSAREVVDDPRFGPDIEATSKLINVLTWTGLLDQTSPAFKAGVVRYMQERQDPETGFFRDPQHHDSYTLSTLNRAIGMAVDSLRDCGGAALHPLPVERLADNTAVSEQYAHLASPEALRTWVDGLPWNKRVWTVGGTIATHTGLVQSLPEPLRGELLAELRLGITKRQAADGYFGSTSDAWFSRLSGSYKLASFLVRSGYPIPQPEQMAATVMNDLFTREYNNLIVLYNTAHILVLLDRQERTFTIDRRLDIIERCTAVIRDFHAPGGGFLTQLGKSSPTANGRLLALERIEGDTNASGLAHRTRALLHELAGRGPDPHAHARGVDLVQALAAAGR